MMSIALFGHETVILIYLELNFALLLRLQILQFWMFAA